MVSAQQLLEDIEAAPDGPEVAAIFDFDGTLIAGYSAFAFIREQVRRGDLSPRELLELVNAMAAFGLGNLGFSGMMAVTAQFMRGIEEDTYIEVAEELYRKQIARLIYPESRALVNAHLAKGHTVAVISSATPYQVAPAARDLDIDHVLCTHMEVSDGKFTGGVVRPTCFGQGKVEAAENLAAHSGADLDQSFFYSDSQDDLQLLERVGKPRALNPSGKLEQIARRNHWPIARFGSRGRPRLGQYLRSVAATSSLVTSFLAGLPIYALTGSRREANNFSFSLFADTASALIGMSLNVKGEENLWSHRPAVFVFNHQSKADVMIIAKLLRRDIAGIGKKEIKRENPLIGMVMQLGGTVFIDRANARDAIESMAPLIDVMQKEGRSVVLAPEGTRTVSPKLAPFKKGAFHIAMQAGVPMVPIVIRNAGDVAPKGDFVLRPATVDVVVLPPIDTSTWRKETLDQHVRDVRNLFARVLGQPEEGGKTVGKPAQRKTAAKGKKSTGKATAKSMTGGNVKTRTKAKAKAKTTVKAGTRTSAKSRATTKPKTVARSTAKVKKKTAEQPAPARRKPTGPGKTAAKTVARASRKTSK